MKVRMGFVSNSSSSSFCIWGVYINSPETMFSFLKAAFKENYIPPELRKLRQTLQRDYPNDDEDKDEDTSGIDWDAVDVDVYDLFQDKMPFYVSSDDDGGWWVGAEWCSIGDDETGRQFKDRVNGELSLYGLLRLGDSAETYNESIVN
jgi:hypothetical protein